MCALGGVALSLLIMFLADLCCDAHMHLLLCGVMLCDVMCVAMRCCDVVVVLRAFFIWLTCLVQGCIVWHVVSHHIDRAAGCCMVLLCVWSFM